MNTMKSAANKQTKRLMNRSWAIITTSLVVSVVSQFVVTQTGVAAEIGYDFTGITTAWDNTTKTAPVSTNTFIYGVTGSNYTLSTTSGRGNAIIDGQTKALCMNTGNETHRFTITIPALSTGTYVNLTNLFFRFDATHYDGSAPGAGWTLSLSQGTASQTNDLQTVKQWYSYNIALTNLTGLNNTSVTFTITDTSVGNNKNTTFWTGFDDIKVAGEVIEPPSGTIIVFF